MRTQPQNNWNYYLILPLYALAFSQFALITADNDLWGHIKFGEELWNQQLYPTTNIYSYTAPDHTWINHEWLAELIVYLIYNLFGSTGLLAFKCVLGLFLVHLIWAHNLNQNANPWIIFISMLLVIPTLAPGFMMRPHLWTLLLLTIFLILITKGIERNTKLLYWIPFVMLIWVNSHGGIVAGMGILTIITLTEGTRSLISGEKLWKPLLICFLCSSVAVLINPHGIELWDFFFHSISKPRHITEWNSIPLWGTQFIFLKILVSLFAITIFLPGKKPLWKIIVISGSIYFGFNHQRHSMLTAIVLAFYLPQFLSKGAESWGKHIPNINNSGQIQITTKITLALFIIFQLVDGHSKFSQNKYKILVEPQVYPSYLAQFMNNNHLMGNILVPFEWGEYFIWQLPDSKVSIDGRFRTAYPESVINWNQRIYTQQNPDSELMQKFSTDIIVVRKKDTPKNFLTSNKEWTKIYEDIITMLFVRKNKVTVLNKFKNNKLIHTTEPPSLNFP